MLDRLLELKVEKLLITIYFIFVLKQIIFGLSFHIIPSSIISGSALLLLIGIQAIKYEQKSGKAYFTEHKVATFLIVLNTLVVVGFSIYYLSTDMGLKKIIPIKSLNIFWTACLLIPPILYQEIKNKNFDIERFFDKVSMFSTYTLGGLFILECFLVRLGWFDRLQVGYFFLGIERLYVRDRWGFLGNETQSTGIIAVTGIYLLVRFLTTDSKRHKKLVFGWLISAISVSLGMSITTALTFYVTSFLLFAIHYRKKVFPLFFVSLFFAIIALFSQPANRLVSYLTESQGMIARFIPEFKSCGLLNLLTGNHAIEVGCRAKDIHLLESYFQTNFSLLIVFLLLLILPLLRIKIIRKNKALMPIFALYLTSLILSIHYDFIASWPSAFLLIISWSILISHFDQSSQITCNKSTLNGSNLKRFASICFCIIFIIALDPMRIIDLPLFQLAGVDSIKLGSLSFSGMTKGLYTIDVASSNLSKNELLLLPLRYYQVLILLTMFLIFAGTFLLTSRFAKLNKLRQLLRTYFK